MGGLSWQERLDKSSLLRSSASLCKERNDFGKAEENLKQALAILKEAEAPDPISLVKVLHELGSLAQDQRLLTKAEEYYLQALDLCEQSLGPVAIGTATRLNNLAWLYRQQGEMEKSESLLIRSLNIYLERLGSVNKPVALLLMALAVLNKRNGNDEQAENYRQELKLIEEELQNSSKEVEKVLRISKNDSARKRKSTTELRRFGIIPGDRNDFPGLDFVVDSLLGDSEGQQDKNRLWERSLELECTHILNQMDDYLTNARAKKKGPIEKFEENSDGTISVQAGNHAVGSALALVRIRISGILEEVIICRANSSAVTTDPAFVPAASVPDYLQNELFRGARIAFLDLLLKDGRGLVFELIEGVVHPGDELKAPYRQAGWVAISGWAKSKGLSMKPDSKTRLWQYPIT